MLFFWVQFSGTNLNWCLDDSLRSCSSSKPQFELIQRQSHLCNELLVIWYLCDLWFSHLGWLAIHPLWRILVCQDLRPSTLSFLSPICLLGASGLYWWLAGFHRSTSSSYVLIYMHNTYTFLTWSCKTCNFYLGWRAAQSFRIILVIMG
jgi:hypothetical protein